MLPRCRMRRAMAVLGATYSTLRFANPLGGGHPRPAAAFGDLVIDVGKDVSHYSRTVVFAKPRQPLRPQLPAVTLVIEQCHRRVGDVLDRLGVDQWR